MNGSQFTTVERNCESGPDCAQTDHDDDSSCPTPDPTPDRTPWHCLVGRFDATVVPLLIDRAIVRAWLHSGLALPDGNDSLPQRVYLYLGMQQSVSPAVMGYPIRIPFCYTYPEIILAVPNLEIRREDGQPTMNNVGYLPRLFLGKWGPTLLGRGLYGICKSIAKFDIGPSSFKATNRRGKPILEMEMTRSQQTVRVGKDGLFEPDFEGFLPQPMVVGKGKRLGLARLAFDVASAEIHAARVSLSTSPALISWMPSINRRFQGCDEAEDGAFHLSSEWTLSRVA